jgi:hypothetical protein
MTTHADITIYNRDYTDFFKISICSNGVWLSGSTDGEAMKLADTELYIIFKKYWDEHY